MSIAAPVRLVCLLLCGVLLTPPKLLAQTASSPPTGTLQLPTKQQGTKSPPTPVKAAPREPVREAKPTPVVRPHGAPHALKPPPAKPSTAVPAAVAPKPAVAPAEPPKPPPEADNTKGSTTGLPLPRFVALRTDDVNMRAGPGTRYPIEWVYKRRDLPIEILREFEVWRLVQDADGIKGWVHQATITGRRSFIVTAGDATLRHDPEDSAAPVAVLKQGVVGHLRSCQANSEWCQVQVDTYRGYLRRSQFWGTLPDEAVANN